MTLAACLLAAAPASAASRLTIRGAGFGHGVGMSQYGAMGFAEHGAAYDEILAHYYSGTALGSADAEPRGAGADAGDGVLRLLLRRRARRHPAPVAGARPTAPPAAASGRSTCSTRAGKRLGTFGAPLQVDGGADGIVLKGRAINGRSDGAYRGILEFRPGAFGMNAINAVPLDAYVQGVVPVESPASWPIEALKAQAVAARTYAITSTKGGNGFEHYPDTRSQVYGGIGVETAATNQAVAETANQVVTYQGRPVTTYFFSTSGGRTENVENSLGGTPQPWLQLRRGSLRRRLAAPPLEHEDAPRRRRREAQRPRQGLLPRHQGDQARRLAARRGRPGVGIARAHPRQRRHPARPLRPLRHLGVLHVDLHQEGASRPRRRRSRRRRSPRRARARAASRRAPA